MEKKQIKISLGTLIIGIIAIILVVVIIVMGMYIANEKNKAQQQNQQTPISMSGKEYVEQQPTHSNQILSDTKSESNTSKVTRNY